MNRTYHYQATHRPLRACVEHRPSTVRVRCCRRRRLGRCPGQRGQHRGEPHGGLRGDRHRPDHRMRQHRRNRVHEIHADPVGTVARSSERPAGWCSFPHRRDGADCSSRGGRRRRFLPCCRSAGPRGHSRICCRPRSDRIVGDLHGADRPGREHRPPSTQHLQRNRAFGLANRIPLMPIGTALTCLFFAAFLFEAAGTTAAFFVPAHVLVGLGAVCFTLFSIVSILEAGTSE
jgi:hypothetical protein